MTISIRLEGVYRVYCLMGLNFKRRAKQRLPQRTPKPLTVEAIPNHQWALDFMHDTLYCGRSFRTFKVRSLSKRETTHQTKTAQLAAAKPNKNAKSLSATHKTNIPIAVLSASVARAVAEIDAPRTVAIVSIRRRRPIYTTRCTRKNGQINRRIVTSGFNQTH